jgi:DNA mismatch repair protein MutS2
MIFPKNFETKIGFNEVRTALRGRCLSSLGAEMVDSIKFLNNPEVINEQLEQVHEFHRIMDEEEDFPEENFLDMRSSLVRIQLKGSYMDESELFALKTSLATISQIVTFLNDDEDEEEIKYPTLRRLTEDIAIFPDIV